MTQERAARIAERAFRLVATFSMEVGVGNGAAMSGKGW